MTVAAAKARGFATASKGALGWSASCPTCPWQHIVAGFAYKGDAAKVADDHNRKYHPERPERRK